MSSALVLEPPGFPKDQMADRTAAIEYTSPSKFEGFDSTVRVRELPTVVFNDDASEQHVWFDGRVVAGSVQQPSGPADMVAQNPVVMSPAYLGFVVEPYEMRYLHYRGVGIVFARPDRGRFMQPSIDTILLCRALTSLFEERGLGFSSLIDVGSGSGFIGKYAATYAPGDGDLSVTLVDIDPAALDYCRTPHFGARSSGSAGRKLSWKFHEGDAVRLLADETGYDLIVSNPPYIPTREEVTEPAESSCVDSFWEGCGLLMHLVELIMAGRCPANAHLVLGLSSLSLKSRRLCALLEEAPKRGVRVRILLEREIAWKAWYAGRGSGPSFLLSTQKEVESKQRIGDCDFFVGATPPGESRIGGERNRLFGYHWHVAYVLDISTPHRPAASPTTPPRTSTSSSTTAPRTSTSSSSAARPVQSPPTLKPL